MAGIGSIVSITITRNTRTPTRQGFGTPCVLAYHAHNADLSRRYTDLTDMVTDGFATSEPAYRMVQALFSQDPRPPVVVVARLTAAPTLHRTFKITDATAGDKILVTVIEPDGTTTAISRTIPGASNVDAEATAVAALIDALTGVAASASTDTVTVTPAVAGKQFYLHSPKGGALTCTDVDGNYDDDLTALRLVDDDWFFVLTDSQSDTNVALVRAWAESNKKAYFYQTQDAGELDGSGTILSAAASAADDFTVGAVCLYEHEYLAAAWVGAGAPKDAGSITWAFKQLKSVTPQVLTATQETHLDLASINGNRYTTIGGLGVTQNGKSASGEFFDIIHGIEWLKARLTERIFALLANADKIPYEDVSVDLFLAEILAQLGEGVDRKFLAPGTLTATGPKVADVSTVDRAARLLPNLKFGATFAGAVHKVTLAGTLTV